MEHIHEFYKEKNVLVTGGAGFIGSHIVDKLVQLGARVTVFDNFSTGKINNLAGVLSQVSIVYADVSSAYSVGKAIKDKDIVFHLAALVSVPLSVESPEKCRAINVDGTQNVLEGCYQAHVKNCIFSSSCAVYGDRGGVCREDDTPVPLSPYAQSKLDGERLCVEYARLYDLNTASLRYFNVYGPRQSPDGMYAGVVAKFTHNLTHYIPITVFGDGSQTRDFVPVSQVVEANIQLGMNSGLHGEVFNIASGKSLSILELVEKLEQDLQVKAANVVFKPARQGDILHSQAHCEKYKNFLVRD